MGPWTLFFGAAVVVMGLVYPLYAGGRHKGRPVLMAGVKGFGTFLAGCVALAGVLRAPDAASLYLTAGLFVCAAADIALNFHFTAGTLLFLAGHSLYLLAMLSLAPPGRGSLVVFVLLLAFVVLLFLPELRVMGRGAALYLLYGSVQLLMLSLALALPAALGARGFAAGAGALLFAVSDIVLAKGFFGGTSKSRPYAVMGLYYTAQLLFSLAALQPWLQ